MTQILYHAVTGATGAQGGATARALLRAGHRVRALTRRPAPELAELGADVVYADFRDRASVDAALRDVDTLFAVTTPFGSSPAQEVADGRTLVDAAAHLKHIVFTSATNADHGTGIPTSRASTRSNDTWRRSTSRGRSSARRPSWTSTRSRGTGRRTSAAS